MIYFTSDTHFGDKKILASRTMFETVEQMDETLIAKWNEKITKDDTVYILGDITPKGINVMKSYVNRLNGKKHLIIGNHDMKWYKNTVDLSDVFESAKHSDIISVDEIYLTLSHFPMFEFLGCNGRYYHIHGHLHNRKFKPYEYIKRNVPRALNAGMDINGFVPCTLTELIENNNKWYERQGE